MQNSMQAENRPCSMDYVDIKVRSNAYLAYDDYSLLSYLTFWLTLFVKDAISEQFHCIMFKDATKSR